MVVVLPAPLGPNRPTISPSLTEKEMESTAARPAYTLRKFSARRISAKVQDSGINWNNDAWAGTSAARSCVRGAVARP